MQEWPSADQLVIDSAKVTAAELHSREQDVRTQEEQLAEQGIFITRHGTGIDGFEISYLAADPVRAERILRDRFGEFATIRYEGASNHRFRPMPFGSWLANEDRLWRQFVPAIRNKTCRRRGPSVTAG